MLFCVPVFLGPPSWCQYNSVVEITDGDFKALSATVVTMLSFLWSSVP